MNIIPEERIDLDKVAILLDIDGTILDFAPTPGEVWVPPSLRRTLQGLFEQTGGALALVSGRSLSDLDLLLAPLQLPAIGGHGAELRPFPGAAADPSRTPSLDRDLKRRLAMVAEIGPGIPHCSRVSPRSEGPGNCSAAEQLGLPALLSSPLSCAVSYRQRINRQLILTASLAFLPA